MGIATASGINSKLIVTSEVDIVHCRHKENLHHLLIDAIMG